jgi:hypothetical protein
MCGFSISTYPEQFNRIIFVPGVRPDIPLCFLIFRSFVVVFVPNSFLCIIDIVSSPPNVSLLPKAFASLSCGICCTDAPLQNHIIDIDKGEVFELRLTLEAVKIVGLPIISHRRDPLFRVVWDVMTEIVARLVNAEHFAHLFDMLSEVQDFNTIAHVYRILFQYWGTHETSVGPSRLKRRCTSGTGSGPSDGLPPAKSRRVPPGTLEHLAALERESPRADGLPRWRWFRCCVKDILGQKECKTVEAAVGHAFEIMEREIQHVLVLREGIDRWVQKFSPDPLTQLMEGITLQSETIFTGYPAVQCLSLEIASLARDFGSTTIQHRCAWARVGRNDLSDRGECEEMDYWNNRLFLPTLDISESDSGSSLFMSAGSTNSMRWSVSGFLDRDQSESLSVSIGAGSSPL